MPVGHFHDCEPQSREGGGAWTAARASASVSPVSPLLLLTTTHHGPRLCLCCVCACDRPCCSCPLAPTAPGARYAAPREAADAQAGPACRSPGLQGRRAGPPPQALPEAAYKGRPEPVYQPVKGHMTCTVTQAKAPPSHTTLSSHIFQEALLIEKGDKRGTEVSHISGLQCPGDGSQQTSQGQRDGHLSSRLPHPAHSAGGQVLTERCPGQRST